MANTKIKGHRIAEKNIEEKHLSENLKFREDVRVELNYPTHSNEADLTLDEKNTLTQLGNADTLHYHTGGGGGPQGIYTNEERDSQLLRLNLLVNSNRFGIERSVRDTLDSDESLDYGLYSAPAPECTVYGGSNQVSGVLPPEKEYTYAAVYANRYGTTNITASTTVKTSTALSNAVSILLKDVPVTNTGFEIYRTEDQVSSVIGEFDLYDRFVNDQYISFYLDNGDKTSGLSSLNLRFKGKEDTREFYSALDVLDGTNKLVAPDGENLNTIITKNVPFTFTVFNMSRKKQVNRIDLVWGPETNLIPEDYEILYSDNENATYGSAIEWKRMDFLSKRIDHRNRETNMSTDGSISENFIEGNSRAHNSFYLGRVINLTAIRVVVRKTSNDVRLFALRAMTEPHGDNSKMTYKLDNPIKLSKYKSLSFDIRSNNDNRNLILSLSNSKDSDISTPTTIVNYNVIDNLHGQPYTMYRAHINTAWASSYDRYDKMRIGIRVQASQYIEFDNVFMIIGSAFHSAAYSPKPIVNVSVTFNGSYEFKGVAPSDGLIWSDWFDCPWASSAYNNYASTKVFTTSLFLKAGKLNCVKSSGATYYNKNAVGLEDVPYLGDVTMTAYGGTFVQQVQIAQSTSPRVTVKANYSYSNDDSHLWQRHIAKIPDCPADATYDTLTIMASDGIVRDQIFVVDNVRATRKEEITANVTPIASNGFTNLPNLILDNSTLVESATYPAQLAPQSFGISFDNLQLIDTVKIMYGIEQNRAVQYAIQYSTDIGADINALYNDAKWINVQKLVIGDSGMPDSFTGQVVDSMVYNNNLYAHMVTHSFAPVSAKAVRVIVFSVSDPEMPVKCSRMAVYNHCEGGEFKLIYKHNGKISNNHVFVDDGKPVQEIKPSLVNTTGSNGVVYDKFLNVIRLINGVTEGTVYFDTLKMPLYKHILMTAQYTGDVEFYLSNNGGESFYKVELEKLLSFNNQSENLTAKAVIKGKNSAINAVAYLYTL